MIYNSKCRFFSKYIAKYYDIIIINILFFIFHFYFLTVILKYEALCFQTYFYKCIGFIENNQSNFKFLFLTKLSFLSITSICWGKIQESTLTDFSLKFYFLIYNQCVFQIIENTLPYALIIYILE